jgi:hypothetical protein
VLTVLHALLACFLGVCAAQRAAPIDLHPRSAEPRGHSLTMEIAYDSPKEVNKTFGWDNFRAVAPYIDMALSGPGALNPRLRVAGIQTVLYLDTNACSAKSGYGANEYAGPDCADWTAGAFYAQDAHPDRVLTVSYNGVILQRIGDPGTPEWQQRTVDEIRDASSRFRFEAVEIDDAGTPDELSGNDPCWGIGTIAGRSYDCTTAPGGVAHPPWNARYSRAEWQAGMEAMAARSPLPVMFNGLAGYDKHESVPAIVDVVVHSANAWGAMCDTCFYGTRGYRNVYLFTHPVVDVRLNGAMRIIAAHKNVIVLNSDVTDPLERVRALAEIMLAYDPDHLWQAGDECGSISLIHACPESALTFYAPYKGYPAGVGDVEDTSGNYVREFARCYDNGKLLGPCATVVNADRTLSFPRPKLRNTYRHTLSIQGTALCNCYGDRGSLSEGGPALPEVIPPVSGYVVFR